MRGTREIIRSSLLRKHTFDEGRQVHRRHGKNDDQRQVEARYER